MVYSSLWEEGTWDTILFHPVNLIPCALFATKELIKLIKIAHANFLSQPQICPGYLEGQPAGSDLQRAHWECIQQVYRLQG